MDCPICLDTIELNTEHKNNTHLLNVPKYKNSKTLKCNHTFHKECIDEWLKKHSNCPYCRTFIKDKLPISIKKKSSYFYSSADIYLPDDYKDDIEIKYRFKNKQIILNKFTIKSFMMPNKYKMVLKYFINYPDTIETLYIKFSNNDSEYLVDLFMKIFKNNVDIVQSQLQQTIASLAELPSIPPQPPSIHTIPNYTQSNLQSQAVIIDDTHTTLTNNYTLNNLSLNTNV